MCSNILHTESIEIKIPIKDETIIGIDIGTTFSCAGIIRNNKVEIVPDTRMGEKIIPSVICYYLNQLLIGRAAANKIFQCEETSMTNSKRLIGHLFYDENVQNDIKFLPPNIYEDKKTKKPIYSFKVGEEEKSFFPEDVSSMILKYIKDNVNAYEGKEVKKAVITVPAHFNNAQREATKEAAKNAGLEVIRIINEPTAAAIAYGDIHKLEKKRTIFVFDLGGGTFDVSILKIKGSEYTVLASCGDDHLGGEDFTKEFTNYLLKLFKEQYPKFKNIDFFNKEKQKEFKAFTRLKEEAEKLKKVLSNTLSANVDLDGLYKEDFAIEIKRGEFEVVCSPLWNKCIDYIKMALINANLKKEDLDEVVLVGGSTRIPKIQEMVQNFINNTEKKKKIDKNNPEITKPIISKSINADEAVAVGAAIVAYIENNTNNSQSMNFKINDITSKSIGIGTEKGKMEIIIPKGTILPVREKPLLLGKTFVPKTDFAKGVSVKIFESDNNDVSVDNLLKKFALTDLPVDVKEKVIIKILMHLDHNGIIKVDAKINDNLMKEVSGIKPSFSFK